jgi:hypothetical protein
MILNGGSMKKILHAACVLSLFSMSAYGQDPIEAHPDDFDMPSEAYPLEESEFQTYDDDYMMQMEEEQDGVQGLEPGYEPHDQMDWDEYGDGSFYDSEINQYE